MSTSFDNFFLLCIFLTYTIISLRFKIGVDIHAEEFLKCNIEVFTIFETGLENV